MRRIARQLAMIGLVALVLPVALPGMASAQYREFTGKVDKINKRKMIVDNRMGDKVTFERLKGTKVEDTSGGKKPKAKWTDLKNDDWVTVRWKMIDKPRKAYEIIVLPEKDEAGEDL
ncbi:MAG: hypothetical protein ACQGVC_16475 [Myxococcota bacterium]